MVAYRTHPDYPGYRFGSDGSFWSWCKGSPGDRRRPPRWRRLTVSRTGCVTIKVGERTRHMALAPLILSVFGQPRPLGFEVMRFPDPSLTNNALGNLRWAPRGIRQLGHVVDRDKIRRAIARSAVARRILSDEEAAGALRLLAGGVLAVEVAERFGVHASTVKDIRNGRSYRHLPRPDGLKTGPKRRLRGEGSPTAKLTRREVREVVRRDAQGEGIPAIARALGARESTVAAILNGRSWCHVTGLGAASSRKRRRDLGERNVRAKLTADKVREFMRRRAAGESYGRIAKDFGVTRQLLFLIEKGKAWSHVTGIQPP